MRLIGLIASYHNQFMTKHFFEYHKKGIEKKRDGKCLMCGKCCEGCSQFDNATRLCKIHHIKGRMGRNYCILAPTPFQIKYVGLKEGCGYRLRNYTHEGRANNHDTPH
jgi:hypothetical protein